MSDKKPSRGFPGAVLKLLRAGDYELTVTGRARDQPALPAAAASTRGGLLDRSAVASDDVDPDVVRRRRQSCTSAATRWSIPNPATDTVDIEFALHDGVASRWAQDAEPGDTIEVTVLGSNFALPEPGPRATSSSATPLRCPPINSLLDRDRRHPGAGVPRSRPRRRQATAGRRAARDVTWVDRKNDGEALVRGGQRGGVRRLRPFRLGGVATTAPPAQCRQDVPRGLQDSAQVHQGASLLGGVTAR